MDPGAVVIAELDPEGTGVWRLRLTVIRTATEFAVNEVRFKPPVGWSPRWDDRTQFGTVRMSPHGSVAFETMIGVLVLDLLGGGRMLTTDGSSPAWAPDGSLVVMNGAFLDHNRYDIVRRITDFGFGEVADIDVPGFTAAGGFGNPVVAADGSGVHGSVLRGEELERVILRWDGTTVARKRNDAPYLERGTERYEGQDGEQILGCDGWGPCPLEWRLSDGKVLSSASEPVDMAWTRDGTALVVLDPDPQPIGDSEVALVQELNDRLVLRPLGPARPYAEVGEGNFYFVGMSSWAAVLERDHDAIFVVPLDGSPAIGPLHGTLALVNP